jgi:hypothetical protein
MNVVPLANKRDWKWHRDRIAGAWGKQVESIVETGQAIIDAKAELDHVPSSDGAKQTTIRAADRTR